ncbi:MAG: cytochrome c [Anaerolineales bacterium]|nr:cytochrome c [Anaerolineales bacterium]
MKRMNILLATILVGTLLFLSACGGNSAQSTDSDNIAPVEARATSGDPEAGEDKFNEVCIACHGPGGVGIEGLGKPFTTSDFLLAQSDEELLAFIKKGRPVGDPTNTTGVDMPPKGGNPALTDEQIMDIIAYIRTLHD